MNSDSLRQALRAFLLSRLFVLTVGLVAYLSLPVSRANSLKFDNPSLTQSLDGPIGTLFSLSARWDSVWFLEIADGGYFGNDYQAAFFPLYPLLTRVVAFVFGGFQVTNASMLVAAVSISLVAFFFALYFLARLVEVELGGRFVTPTLLLVAFFPMSFFYSAAYSESLFLLLAVGCFYFARTDRWLYAGILGGLAATARSAGVLMLIPLVILYLWGPRGSRGRSDARAATGLFDRFKPRFRLRPNFLWLLLVPAGLIAYMGYLAIEFGEPLRYATAQEFWHRHFLTPLGGIYEGASAAFQGARQLLHGSRDPVYWTSVAGDPFRIAIESLVLFVFLVLALVAVTGVFRRLPFAYGAYAAVAIALPLSYPAKTVPLMSFPRFAMVVFPLYMWAALVLEKRGWTGWAVVVSAIALSFFTSLWATWQWVS